MGEDDHFTLAKFIFLTDSGQEIIQTVGGNLAILAFIWRNKADQVVGREQVPRPNSPL
ncbi:hypothetical protein ACMV5I_01305 [Serratia sp. T13T92]